MKLFGSLSELVSLVWRKDSQAITLRPSQAVTYTAARDVQTPAENADSVLVSRTSTDTLSNKTLTSPSLTSPTISGGTHTGVTTFSLDDTASAFNLALQSSSATALTANRSLIFDVNNADRTLDLGGDVTTAGALTTAGAFITSGASSLTLTTTGATNVTLPTTGTLATLAGSETLSSKTLTSPIVTDGTLRGVTLLQSAAGGGNPQPQLRLSEDPDTGTDYVALQAPASLTTTYTLTLPPDDGDSGEVLSTNGSGVLDWTAAATVPSEGAVYSNGTALQTAGSFAGNANEVVGVNSGATAVEYKALATGTSGTDFAIAHAAGSVTFNLPDASATARGLITTGAQTLAGDKNFTGQVKIADGTAGEPSLVFSSDDDTSGTGIYRVASNSLGFSANGSNVGQYSSAGSWTLGPTGGPAATTLTVNTANDQYGVLVKTSTTSGQRPFLGLYGAQTSDNIVANIEFVNQSPGAVTIAQIYASRSGANNSGKLSFETRNAGTGAETGSISPLGSWTVGPAAGGVSHIIQGNDEPLIINSTAGSLASLLYRTGGTTRGYLTFTNASGFQVSNSTPTVNFSIASDGTTQIGQLANSGANHFAGGGDNGTSPGNEVFGVINRAASSGTAALAMNFYDAAGDTCGSVTINQSANTASFNTSSDARLKTLFADFNALAMIAAVPALEYERISAPGTKEYGFKAQDLAPVLPQAVTEGGEDESVHPWVMDYGKLTGVLWKAIQELKQQFDDYVAAHP